MFSSKHALFVEKFRIENRRAGGSANRVVTAKPEFVIKNGAGLDRSDHHSHAIASVAVQPWLGPFNIALHENARARCAGQLELIDRRAEIADRGFNFIARSLLAELYGYGFKMPVANVNTMRLRTHANRSIHKSIILPLAEQL